MSFFFCSISNKTIKKGDFKMIKSLELFFCEVFGGKKPKVTFFHVSAGCSLFENYHWVSNIEMHGKNPKDVQFLTSIAKKLYVSKGRDAVGGNVDIIHKINSDTWVVKLVTKKISTTSTGKTSTKIQATPKAITTIVKGITVDYFAWLREQFAKVPVVHQVPPAAAEQVPPAAAEQVTPIEVKQPRKARQMKRAKKEESAILTPELELKIKESLARVISTDAEEDPS